MCAFSIARPRNTPSAVELALPTDDVRGERAAPRSGQPCPGEAEVPLRWVRYLEAADDTPEAQVISRRLAAAYISVGQFGDAIDCLDRAVDHGFRQRAWFEHDADLKALRGSPRFHALLDRLS